FLTALLVIFSTLNFYAQTVTNGDFNGGTTGWGDCINEIGNEVPFGGPNMENIVAEIDENAGLCQTISGFTIGEDYEFNFDCSLRTTCGPAVQSLNISVDGDALSEQSVSRTGGVFEYIPESFLFTATATSHTINFVATITGSCGLVVDNIEVGPAGSLPVELVNFNAGLIENDFVRVSWQTATEINNDFFTVERSSNGKDWEKLEIIEGAGDAATLLSYSVLDDKPLFGISYYRLKQTDFDERFSYSQIRSINNEDPDDIQIEIYPKPTTAQIYLSGNETELEEISIYNISGQNVTANTKRLENQENKLMIDLSNLISGMYFIKTKTTVKRVYKE
ncbi:MAG: hypothetical protein ACI956_002679, partial [Nonlabens sp.]